MKKFIVQIRFTQNILPVVLFFILNLLFSPVGAQKKQLVILHTNDTHSQIFPITSQLPDTMKAGRGGFLRRIAMLKEERAKNPDLLYFDSGDFFQGSAYFTLFKGDVEVGLMNQMGIDASTIGNHEFDFGLENMARVFKKANFPILCTNYDFTGTVMEGITKPYIIIKRNGVKIGVFTVCPKKSGTFESEFFTDDGESYAYLSNDCVKLKFSVECGANDVSVKYENLGNEKIIPEIRLCEEDKRTLHVAVQQSDTSCC